MKPVCTVMVGLPASGKSTYVSDMSIANPDAFVYSTDRFIEDVAKNFGTSYDQVFKNNIKRATEAMNAQLDRAIEHRLDIIWDQTNLSVKKRKNIIGKISKFNYTIECICVEPPEPENDDFVVWKTRLNSRPSKIIPEYVITNMTETFVEPAIGEGFDTIIFCDIYGGKLRRLDADGHKE